MPVSTGSSADVQRMPFAGDLPPRVRGVLDNVRRTVSSELARQLQVTVHDAELDLTRLLDRARASGGQADYAESLRVLHLCAFDLIRRFSLELEEQLTKLRAPRVAQELLVSPISVEGWSLVDDSEVDEGALLEDIATRSSSRNSLTLQLMGQRFGVLAGAPAFEAEHLPVGPHAMCHALRNAATELGLPLEARLALYRQFDKLAMASFPTLLEALNDQLASDGILPHLNFVPVRVRPASERIAPESAGSARNQVPATDSAPEPPVQQTVTLNAQSPAGAVFAELQDLLARRRLLLAKLRPVEKETRQRQSLGSEEVIAALLRMRTSPAKSGTPNDISRTLLAQARQQHGHGVALERADSDGFELFGLFFSQLRRELRANGPGEALVERLKVPLLQVTLRDHRFLVDPTHPARTLLNAVSLAGARWLAGDDLDAQWLGLLQRAVATVESDPNASDETFVAASHVLQDGLQSAARKHEMAERRQVEAARGREKLELARLRASDEIAQLLAGRPLPRFQSMLLEQAWTDVLSLTLLRNGELSDAWHEARDTTRSLIGALGGDRQEATDPALLLKVQSALGQVGYHADDAGAIARQLVNGRGEEADLASRTELVVQLKARARLGEEQLGNTEKKLPMRTPAEDDAFERLCVAGHGCWIDLYDPVDERAIRRRLAWVSERTGQTLVLNRRSLRVDTEGLDALARRLAAGELQLVDEDVYPAEMAWRSTFGNLHRIAEGPAAIAGEGR